MSVPVGWAGGNPNWILSFASNKGPVKSTATSTQIKQSKAQSAQRESFQTGADFPGAGDSKYTPITKETTRYERCQVWFSN